MDFWNTLLCFRFVTCSLSISISITPPLARSSSIHELLCHMRTARAISKQHGVFVIHVGLKHNKEMDKDFFPEPGRLLTFVRKLKEVFDVCDEDSDGFIRPEHFVQLGSQFGQAEQVSTRVLDLQ